jgi:hypothetical protein
MKSQHALYQYKNHGPLSLGAGKALLDNNPKAVLRGYCSGPDNWVGPYNYAIIDLCDLETTIHVYDPDQSLGESHGGTLRAAN